MPLAPDSKQRKLTRQTYQAYRRRIAELREAGKDEDLEVNEASEKAFWDFIKSLPATREGSLFLMENGNFRVIWKGPKESHLALQFLGGREIQYVILKRRKRAKQTSRVAGTDTFDGIKRQIDTFELNTLVS